MPWWPEPLWTAMRAGEDCPMCADAHLPENPHSLLLKETEHSYIRLHRNQTRAGYSLVISKHHVPELHDLSARELRGFCSDVAATGRAVETAFRPVKLATLSMGFRVPHLHFHVVPQYEHDDPLGLTSVDPSFGDTRLDDIALRDRADRLSSYLGV